MGILDLLGDLSSKRSQKLGLGGLQSLLGTRKAAEFGALGDEMISIANKDSLPGYFNEQTREYVPWYVDLFDGGGFNSAGGEDTQAQAASPSAQASALPRQISPQARPVQSDILNANMTESIPENLAMSSLTTPGTGWDSAIGQTREQPSAQMPFSENTNLYMSQSGMPTMPNPYLDRNLPYDQDLAPYSARPADGILSLPAQAEPATSSENLFLDRLLSGELAESNRAALNGGVETKGFDENVTNSDGTSFIPYGVPKPGEGLGVETFGSGNAYSNQHYSVDPVFPAFIKSFPQALEQPSVIPLLLAQYKAKRGL